MSGVVANAEKQSIEKKEADSYSESARGPVDVNAKLANPLEGIPQEQLMDDAEAFAKKYGLGELSDVFRKAALVAQDPLGFETLPHLTDEDRECLRREVTHRWDQPKMLYYLVILCSVAAAVQGVSCLSLGSRSFHSWIYSLDGRDCGQWCSIVLCFSIPYRSQRRWGGRGKKSMVARPGQLCPIRM